MSENIQNNQTAIQPTYYELGIFSINDKQLIKKYITKVHFMMYDNKIIHEMLMNFLYKEHGKGVIVLWNERIGEPPRDIDEIKLEIPEQILNYNK